jgi:GNAT superfamily N-acetyltransferase
VLTRTSPLIRPATSRDMRQVVDIAWTVWHETQAQLAPIDVVQHRSRDFFFRRAKTWDGTALALLDGSIVGFVAWKKNYVEFIFLLPDARCRRIGAALLAEAVSEIARSGHLDAALSCMFGNASARRFYERNGWRSLGLAQVEAEVAKQTVPVNVWQMEKRIVEQTHALSL